MKESSWCERRDLNPYGITTRPSNVRVCQFRHSRVDAFYYTESRRVCQGKVFDFARFFTAGAFPLFFTNRCRDFCHNTELFFAVCHATIYQKEK